jgi:D-3-phosphoglycerate dehydrogenase
MSRYRVVVTDQVFPSVDIERTLLAKIDAELEVASGKLEDVVAKGKQADALLNTYFPMEASTIAQLERCKIIARYGIGTDNLDKKAAQQAGIVVTNVPDYCVEEVADHSLALLLAVIRRIPKADALVRGGGWGVSNLQPIDRISELTVGLVGYGKIPRRLGSVLMAMGAKLLVYDPYVKPGPGIPPLVSLEELLKKSDAVSIHAPLTEETRGLIGARQLEMMPNNAVLINTSRGPLVVLDDVVDALRRGVIRGAGLDVFDKEPLDPKLIEGVPGLIVTPHCGYYSEAALRESQTKAATQIIKVLTGEKPDYPILP